jgi:carboxynorspermidine decarboxylase
LAGDVIGTYRLERPPKSGDRLLFLDQAYYTMVKSTTFNGTQLPAIALWDSRTDALRVIREFGYDTFESRLG